MKSGCTNNRSTRSQRAATPPARFAAAKRRPPAGATTQAVGRPDGCAVRAREARRKRERRPSGRACSQPWNPLSFSISLPKQANQRLVFEGTKSTAALWQIKVDVVPMRHRAQKVLAFCATMPNCGQLEGGFCPQKPSLERPPPAANCPHKFVIST